MPSRSSCSARRSPTPLRNLTGVSSRSDWVCRVALGGIGTARSAGSDRSLGQQMLGELLRLERLEIVQLFAHPEKADGQPKLTAERGDCAPAGAAVELGDDDAGEVHRVGKEAPLLHRVLTHGAVQHPQ